MNWKEKIGYIWDYYKLWIIGACAVLVVFFAVLFSTFGIHKDVCLQITMINADTVTVDNSSLFTEYEKKYCDTDFEKIEVEATLQMEKNDTGSFSGSSYQVLSAELLTGEIDLLISDKDTFTYLSETDCFADLRDFLSKEEQEQYEPYFIYGTAAEGEESIPVGISLEKCERFEKEGYYQQEAAAGIPALCENSENAVGLINYLFSE